MEHHPRSPSKQNGKHLSHSLQHQHHDKPQHRPANSISLSSAPWSRWTTAPHILQQRGFERGRLPLPSRMRERRKYLFCNQQQGALKKKEGTTQQENTRNNTTTTTTKLSLHPSLTQILPKQDEIKQENPAEQMPEPDSWTSKQQTRWNSAMVPVSHLHIHIPTHPSHGRGRVG